MSYRDHCTAGKIALNSPGHDRSGQRAGPAKPSAGPSERPTHQAAQGIGSVWTRAPLKTFQFDGGGHEDDLLVRGVVEDPWSSCS